MNRVEGPATYLDFYDEQPLVAENSFVRAEPQRGFPPTYAEVQAQLPEPIWDGHRAVIDCYDRTWQLAFRHLKPVSSANGFVAPYIDTAFNECLFMWDSAFILLFARYGARAFDFQRTLDNFYAKQHPDGFISREIKQWDGGDRFHRHDLVSTGPNVLPWTEWEHYLNFGDRDRIARVFPPLLAYHRWMRTYRTWPDGSYFTSGLGSGMDNQPRERDAEGCQLRHGHLTWIDATAQALLSAQLLGRMAEVLERTDEIADLRREAEALTALINEQLWDDARGFYCDRGRDGRLRSLETIGAYWALLAGCVPAERRERFVAHLRDEGSFARPHRVPSIAANHPDYADDGDYWRGGVWPPTNYMILRGLSGIGEDALAHQIGRNHLDNVVAVFEQTGTLWENYAPESPKPGRPAKGDFVGWSGLGPVAVLFEYVFGLRPDAMRNVLEWDLRLVERHGVHRYPFGRDGLVTLEAAARDSVHDRPSISAQSTVPLSLVVRWEGGEQTLQL